MEHVDRSRGERKEILITNWIFKVKENGKLKARLVVRSCHQKSGNIDIFSLVVDSVSLNRSRSSTRYEN